MPHPDLPELYGSLKSAVQAGASNKKVQSIADEIARRIQKKHNRLSKKNNQISLVKWVKAIRSSPNQINAYLKSSKFSVLQRRDIEIEYHYSGKASNIYCPKYDEDIKTVRKKKRIILENPHIIFGNNSSKLSIQSWARTTSLSYKYNRHLSNSSGNQKSKYLKGIDVKSIEYFLYQHGIGILYSPRRIFIYGKFKNEIGKLSTGVKSQYLKLQCDRVTRQKGTGTKTEIHGYPISNQELSKDFRDVPSHYSNKIISKSFKIP